MTLDQFLRTILPTSGNYYTVQITSSDAIRQFKHTTIAGALASINAIAARHHNAYIATGSFGEKRSQASCKLKRAWYVDIDCKPGGQYPDKATAIKAIKAAIKSGLPQFTLLNDSGNGYHPYWACSEDVARTDWDAYAKALQVACAKHNLKVDSVVTEDAARILRAPETLNYKDPKHPKPCKILASSGVTYTFAEFAEAMNPYLTGPTSVPSVDNSDLYGGLPEGKEAKAGEMVRLCPVFAKSAAEHGANDSEPLWHKVIHTLAYCEDGGDFVHPLSDGHPGYSKGKTERKFAFSIKKREQGDGGPSLCDTFAKLSTECAACEYRGKIKTPIKLGFGEPPELPWPWRNGDKGVERAGEDGWEQVIRYQVKDFSAVYVPNDNTYATISIDKVNIHVALEELNVDNRSIQKLLSKNSVPLDNHEVEEFKKLVNAWMEQLRNAKQISIGTGRFGWVDDDKFHYAGTIYSAAGENPTQMADRAMLKTFSPKGELEPWRACANHILSQPRYASWAVIASAFAAPLLSFTGVSGTLLSIVSQDTGTGKSTAMKVAQGVWGSPKSGMASLDDTANSVAHRLGTLNNLPAYWDEIREKDHVLKFIHVVFRLSQGREKSRLNSNIQQREAGEWGTMLTIASNEPLKDHIQQQIGNSDAGVARVFEIRAEAIGTDGMNDGAARHFFKHLDHNYGEAGKIYARYLGANSKTIETMVEGIDKKIAGSLHTTKDERFWVATISALIAGAQIATNLNICTFDMRAFKTYLLNELKVMRLAKATTWQTPTDRAVSEVARFLHEKKEYVVRAKTLPQRGGKGGTILLDSLRHPAVIRYAVDDAKIRIMEAEFSKWYYDRDGAGYSDIIANLITAGAVKVRGAVDTGTPTAFGGRHHCIDIDLSNPAMRSLATEPAAITDNSDLG